MFRKKQAKEGIIKFQAQFTRNTKNQQLSVFENKTFYNYQFSQQKVIKERKCLY